MIVLSVGIPPKSQSCIVSGLVLTTHQIPIYKQLSIIIALPNEYGFLWKISPVQDGHPGLRLTTWRLSHSSAHAACAACLQGSLTCAPGFSSLWHMQHASLLPGPTLIGVATDPTETCWMTSLRGLPLSPFLLPVPLPLAQAVVFHVLAAAVAGCFPPPWDVGDGFEATVVDADGFTGSSNAAGRFLRRRCSFRFRSFENILRSSAASKSSPFWNYAEWNPKWMYRICGASPDEICVSKLDFRCLILPE